MKPNEILELVRAGYTKEEIAAMEETPETPETPEEKEKPEEPAKEEEPAKKEEDPKINELLEAIKDLKEDLRKRSLLADDYQPEDPSRKAEEILASIINPFEKKK